MDQRDNLIEMNQRFNHQLNPSQLYQMNRNYPISNIGHHYYKNDFHPLPPQSQVKFEANEVNYNYFPSEAQRRFQRPQIPFDQRGINFDLFQIQKKSKKQKYKRSTNNSHKKFISAIRRLFYAVISTKQKQEFQVKYGKFKSCRTFFFIIMAYMKHRFAIKLLNSVKAGFMHEMRTKIQEYTEEINRTKNKNLKNFREEEIVDIKYSIKACHDYFNGNEREAIQSMYKKDKSTVIKRQHYQSALKTVHQIQKELSLDPRSPLEQPYVEQYSPKVEKLQKLQRQQKKIKRQMQDFELQLDEKPSTKMKLQDIEKLGSWGDKYKHLKSTMDYSEDEEQEYSKGSVSKDNITFLYPPMFPPISPSVYNPYNSPFSPEYEQKKTKDIRQDFFGFLNYGFPRMPLIQAGKEQRSELKIRYC